MDSTRALSISSVMCKSLLIWGRPGATMLEATGERRVKQETVDNVSKIMVKEDEMRSDTYHRRRQPISFCESSSLDSLGRRDRST